MDANYRKLILGVSLDTIFTILFAIVMFIYGFTGLGFLICIFIILQIIFIVMMVKKAKNQKNDELND